MYKNPFVLLRPESCSAHCCFTRTRKTQAHSEGVNIRGKCKRCSHFQIIYFLFRLYSFDSSTMVDMLTRVFRTFASQGQVRKELRSTPSIYSTLLVGEHNISRSLLLLTAVTAASQLGVKVVFFTQTHIQQLPTFLQKRIPLLDPDSLKVLIAFLAHTDVFVDAFKSVCNNLKYLYAASRKCTFYCIFFIISILQVQIKSINLTFFRHHTV